MLNGAAADDLVVVAMNAGEPAVFLLDSTADGVVVESERTLDGTRPMATITFTAAPAIRLSGHGPVDDTIERNVDLALAVLSAEQVGACERVLEIATEYARTREQFDRPIGSFQAIKHKCADMLVDLEWARSASAAALESVDGDAGETAGECDWRASMAKAVCSEALRDAAHANVQIHGGIGFTWEDSAHLYLRRARTDEVLFGGPGDSTGTGWPPRPRSSEPSACPACGFVRNTPSRRANSHGHHVFGHPRAIRAAPTRSRKDSGLLCKMPLVSLTSIQPSSGRTAYRSTSFVRCFGFVQWWAPSKSTPTKYSGQPISIRQALPCLSITLI